MRRAAILSLTLNVLLVGLLGWLGRTGAHAPSGRARSGWLTNRVLRAAPRTSRPTSPATATAAAAEITETFHWSQLESSQYHHYVANLHAIGCPEQTVRDIITADVNSLFAPRVRALVEEPSGHFWQLILHPQEMEKQVNEKHDQLRELQQERDGLFQALFDHTNPHAAEDQEVAAQYNRRSLGLNADFLSTEKRSHYFAATEEKEKAWSDYQQTPDLTATQQAAKRKELEAAYWAALGESLTPEELGELRLRNSGAAAVRLNLVGLELSEAEMRRAVELKAAPEDASAQPGSTAVSTQEDALRELLGPERYEVFQRASDERYTPLYRLAQRLELPAAATAQAFDIRLQVEQEMKRLATTPKLTSDERQNLLQALRTETQQQLTATLGPKGWAAYQKMDVGWLPSLPPGKP